MPLTNYTELKDEIADHLDRDDLTAKVDTFIDLAEARHAREIRIREMLKRSQTTIDERFEALPSGFLEMQSMRLLTDPVTVLSEVSLHEMTRLRQETTGKPEYFTVYSEIEFDRVPDSLYTAEMVYYARLTALSDANPTNALLNRAPDAYLYAALVAAEPYLLNDERIRTWAGLYESARDSLTAMDRRRAGPLVARVQGATP